MNSKPGLVSSFERRVTFALVIGLMFLLCVACDKDKESANTDGAQTKVPTEPVRNERHQHDIPPEIAIDVGSFRIETDEEFTPATTSAIKKANYKAKQKDATIKLIRVVRTDDGAILYQNFEAHEDTEIEFTTDPGSGQPGKVTLKPSLDRKTLDFETTDADLAYSSSTPQPKKRTNRLENPNYKITKIAITKPNSPNPPTTFFSHDTTTGKSEEYPDRRYRVLIRVEKK